MTRGRNCASQPHRGRVLCALHSRVSFSRQREPSTVVIRTPHQPIINQRSNRRSTPGYHFRSPHRLFEVLCNTQIRSSDGMTGQLPNPLHLYRALLRQTTYAFDQNVRKWTQHHITSVFHKKATKVQVGKRWKLVPYNPDYTPSESERKLLKRGRAFLTLLERANQGYQRSLWTLLQLVYGRKGPRKRHLMTPFLRPQLSEGPSGSLKTTGRSVAQQTSIAPVDTKSGKRKISADFMSLLQTQSQVNTYLAIRTKILLKPKIDKINKAGLPMPPSRLKTAKKTWVARMAAAMQPPLPEDEWEHLKAIAMRKHEFTLIPRRPTATRIPEVQTLANAEILADAIVSGVEKTTSILMRESIDLPHKMTPRFLSRFYSRHVFNHSSVAKVNPTGKGMVFKWDNGRRDVVAPAKPRDSTQIEALFG